MIHFYCDFIYSFIFLGFFSQNEWIFFFPLLILLVFPTWLIYFQVFYSIFTNFLFFFLPTWFIYLFSCFIYIYFHSSFIFKYVFGMWSHFIHMMWITGYFRSSDVYFYANMCLCMQYFSRDHMWTPYDHAHEMYVNDLLLGSAGLWVYVLNSELELGCLPALPSFTLAVGIAREKKAINHPIPALLSVQPLEACTKWTKLFKPPDS